MLRTGLKPNRREFMAGAVGVPVLLYPTGRWSQETRKPAMRMGLVTYQWGRDWDLPTAIVNCEKAGFQGVELRTEHAHRVEPELSPAQRAEVRRRFADSPVEFVGYGSNQEFHSPDPEVLKRNIEGTYELVKLCHDIGATGVKVKPNDLPDGVPRERTIEQIGMALNRVGRFAADYGQKIRVEVHGRRTAEIPVMKAIFDHVTEPAVVICWNCNDQDLQGAGLEANFNLLKGRFGDTLHVRELNDPKYPYPVFFRLLAGMNYTGWILLEAGSQPADRVAAMKEQNALFLELAGGGRG